eukprot:294857-Ditylum_brightwellii.AAC.1
MSHITPKTDASKKKCPKFGLDKHWTNQCTSEEKKTPKKDTSGKTPWYLVPQPAGTTHLKYCDVWHNWCMNCNPPSWICHKPGDEYKKFVDHCKYKKATASTLAAVEIDTVAGIAVTEDGKIPAIIPHKTTNISWEGL